MKRSTDRILTSHAGSLARPADLIEPLSDKTNGRPYDELVFANRLSAAVTEVVRQQSENGIDVVSDGELSKPEFADYVADRLSGFEGDDPNPSARFMRVNARPNPHPGFDAWWSRGMRLPLA